MNPENFRFVFVKRIKRQNVLAGTWVKSGEHFGIVTKNLTLINILSIEVELEDNISLYSLKEKKYG
jgi:hypothetical protein